MTNKQKSYDNRQVSEFLKGYISASEVCEDYPWIDDIFSGVLELKTEGNNATRSLSRRVLFNVLLRCQTISVESVSIATGAKYAYRTVAEYALLARVASKSITRHLSTLRQEDKPSLGEEREGLDAPYYAELEDAGLLCDFWC